MSVVKLKKAFKTEILLTDEQKEQVNKTIGVARFLYNFYIAENQKHYENYKKINKIKDERKSDGKENNKRRNMKINGKTIREYIEESNPNYNSGFVGANDFELWMNNEFLPKNQEYSWVKEVSSKSNKKALTNGEAAFKKFFKKEAKYPKFKKKRDQEVKCYFPKNNPTDYKFDRHMIVVPTIGKVRFKEFGYIPKNAVISSATISKKADRYYISVLATVTKDLSWFRKIPKTKGIGLDLGIKDFIITDRKNLKFGNINKTKEVKRLEKKLKREQRALSRKYLSYEKANKKVKRVYTQPNSKKKLEFACKNIDKQILKVQKVHKRLNNIRIDYVKKAVYALVKTKPEYITIENLRIKNMMKNKHLAKAVANQNFFTFTELLKKKCKEFGIELRQVASNFPSSKLCSNCGHVHKELKLKDRVYVCPECKFTIDRDLQAGINLRDAKKYKVLVKGCYSI